jgi:hypothetical protein
MNRALSAVLLLCAFLVGSCVVIVQGGSVREIDSETDTPTRVTVPMKAFLYGGDVVVYADGALVSRSAIQGRGYRYTLGREDATLVEEMPLDSIIGIEAFEGGVNPVATVFATAGATGLATVGSAALAVAIFGSCPTFYASTEQGGALQAEAFSYSIASHLEAEDVDRLFLGPDEDGLVRLELRNEALETHYINYLELVVAEHPPQVHMVPDEEGSLLGTRAPKAPMAAHDRDGRSVLREVVASDDQTFSSADTRILAATTEDSKEHLDLVFPRPESKMAVVVLDLRNSLLNTVLYYDLLLGTTGAHALNWWGGSLERIVTAFQMAQWYLEVSGLAVQVPQGNDWKTVARIPDTGPIAWKELGVEVPVPEEGPVRVRLSFLADDWRINRVSLASPAEGWTSARIPVSRVLDAEGEEDPAMASLLAAVDDDYLITYPGASASLEFAVPEPPPGKAASYLLATQGYYIEWVRPEWIRKAQQTSPFQPGPGSVETLMAVWKEKKSSFEDAFYGSKIPVR